jgi:hypothetical protein
MASVDVAVSVNATLCVEVDKEVNVGKMSCNVGEAGMIVFSGGGVDSARASEMPPITRMMETRAMIIPPPS